MIFGLVFGLVDGLFVGLDEILRPPAVSERSAANEGTSRSLRYALCISSAGVVLLAAMAWLLSVLRSGPGGAMSDASGAAAAAAEAAVGMFVAFLALNKGGFFVLRHWAVRAQLQQLDLAPRHHVQFLDEAAALLFLRKTGGPTNSSTSPSATSSPKPTAASGWQKTACRARPSRPPPQTNRPPPSPKCLSCPVVAKGQGPGNRFLRKIFPVFSTHSVLPGKNTRKRCVILNSSESIE